MTFGAALTLLLVAAKIFGAIAWPWLYVFSPLIAELVLTIIALTIYFMWPSR